MTQDIIADDLRQKIIQDPSVVLEDTDLMRALVSANDQASAGNIIDLRSVALARLEARFDRLEDTHRSVVSAAYDNLAGTHQVHRAVLRLLEADTLEAFLTALGGDVASILRVDATRLVMETPNADVSDDSVALVPENYVDGYMSLGRKTPARPVTLRAYHKAGAALYGTQAASLKSEACLRLDFGQGQRPAMLLMASTDKQMFTPHQATDFLAFFAGVAERTLQRWLAD